MRIGARELVAQPALPAKPGLLLALLLFELAWAWQPPTNPFEPATAVAWLAGIGVFLVLTRPATLPSPLALLELLTTDWLLLGILLLALLLRVVNLDGFPLFHGDEGEMGVDALAIALGDPKAPNFFGTGWFGHPSLHFYLEALGIKLFGVTILALRVVTAFWGVLGVAATYLAARIFANRTAGLLAAAIAASAPVDVHLSRVSLNNVETSVLCTLTMVCLYLGLRPALAVAPDEAATKFWDDGLGFRFGLAGVFAGLGLYFYFASRLVPVVIALVLLFALARWREHWLAVLKGGGAAAAGLLVVALPLLVDLQQNPGTNGSPRAEQFWLPAHVAEAEQNLHVSSFAGVLWTELQLALSQFFIRPDGSTFFPFNAPILLGPVAALFAGGMLLALLRPGRLEHGLLLIWFWTTLIVGNVLFGYAPYTPRIVGLLPVVFVLAGMALAWFMARLEEVARVRREWLDGLAAVLMIALAASSINSYFFTYFRGLPHPAATEVARFVAGLSEGTYVYDLPDGLFFAYGPTRYLGYRISGEDLLDPFAELPRLQPPSRHLAFIVFPRWMNALNDIVQRYPGGKTKVFENLPGEVIFATYVVDS